MGVVIAGTGRAGTSLLVRLMTECGFATPGKAWHGEARAGLEARVRAGGPLEVFKDPWFHEYFEELTPDIVQSIDPLIIPVRDRSHAVASRMVQDRGARLEASPRSHAWRSRTASRGIPGGIVVRASKAEVSAALGEGLWDVLEFALRRDVPIRLVHFPRFVSDFDHLWSSLGDVLERARPRDEVHACWSRTMDGAAVRIGQEDPERYAHLGREELVGLIERVGAKLDALKTELRDQIGRNGTAEHRIADLEAQVRAAIAERDQVRADLELLRAQAAVPRR